MARSSRAPRTRQVKGHPGAPGIHAGCSASSRVPPSPTACAGSVTCCFFGDGAFAEGEFHETANLASRGICHCDDTVPHPGDPAGGRRCAPPDPWLDVF
ncbi:thiamine pyrophosphate-dependent enzyme [Streptomyces mirabilis]|uniref:thiamine pyrophosphate-dependent enzyme n=1 Tax=Streptomyces mirabilis TaxID=68239 RepID=UPI0036783D1B